MHAAPSIFMVSFRKRVLMKVGPAAAVGFMLVVGAVSALPVVAPSGVYDWGVVDQVVEFMIDEVKAMPGAVAMVLNEQGVLYQKAFGSFTYGVPPPLNPGHNPAVDIESFFDLASCTKVTGATNAIAQFYQRGELSLDTKVADIIGSEFAQAGKGPITVLNCLLHNAGYPPDPNPNYWDPAFHCPETAHYHPQENFSCQQRIYNSLLQQTLINPVGSKYVYSDLSFITLMYVVGHLAKEHKYVKTTDMLDVCLAAGDLDQPWRLPCYFEAYVRMYVFEPLKMHNTAFLPPKGRWARSLPTENDTVYLHRVIQGQVSDGNAYALGGIAGHAGLFSTAPDLAIMMHRLMFAAADDSFLNRTTVDFFTREYNHSQSSRALGWNTNDPGVFDYGWNLSCGSLSPKTWTHIGYTGTQLCGDPERQIITILLTNRVYPSAAHNHDHEARVAFNNAVVNVLDGVEGLAG